jgi:DNA-binding winged helix-turn-helix (wHTH) protein
MSLMSFGPFRLDSRSLELWRDGTPVAIRPQPCRALALLASRSGLFVARAELAAALWRSDVNVDVDLGLNSCVKQVRATLGDSARRPTWIETLPRRGYRFLRPVTREQPDPRRAGGRLMVLPIMTLGAPGAGDARSQAFALALGDELEARLSRTPGAQVTLVAGAMLAPAERPSLGTMRQQGIDLALDCRLHCSPGAARVAAQLLDVGAGTVLWGDLLDGVLDDTFDSARRIADEIRQALSELLDAGSVERRLAG